MGSFGVAERLRSVVGMSGCCVASVVDVFHGDFRGPGSWDLHALADFLRRNANGGPIGLIMKLTQGVTTVDPITRLLWPQAVESGLFDVLGLYHFTLDQGTDAGIAQASFMWRAVLDVNGGPLEIGQILAGDHEWFTPQPSRNVDGACAYAFQSELDQRSQQWSGLYTNRAAWRELLGGDMAFAQWWLWEADDRGNTPAGPAWPNEGVLTQFGQMAVPGVPGSPLCDVNHVEDGALLLRIARNNASRPVPLPHPYDPGAASEEDEMVAFEPDWPDMPELDAMQQAPMYRALADRLLAYNGAPLPDADGIGLGVPYKLVPFDGRPVSARLTRDGTAVRVQTETGHAFHVPVRPDYRAA